MPTAQLNGITLSYEDHGSGMPLVLMHGYGSGLTAWRGQVEPISRRYRLILMDMRGHAGTDSPEDQSAYSEQHVVEDLAALLRHVGVDRAVIGGLSLGGYMSLAFNLAHPEMTRALVLCDTGPGYKNPASREKWNETVFRRAERFEELGLDALNRSPEVEQVRQTQRSAAGLAKAARGMLAQFDSRVIDSLESIAVPTLVIVGENDTPFLAGTDYMASKIPHARKVVIADAGHSSNIDQPQAFNAAVLEFLDEVAARP